jgi:hypothetical protein
MRSRNTLIEINKFGHIHNLEEIIRMFERIILNKNIKRFTEILLYPQTSKMIFRNHCGEIVILNKYDFKNDLAYYHKIMELQRENLSKVDS